MQNRYEKFLEEKLKDEHTLTHLLQEDVDDFKNKQNKILKDIAILRKNQNQAKWKIKQLEENNLTLQMELKQFKQTKNAKLKEGSEKRIKEERQKVEQTDPKTIFRQYLDCTFPKYKTTVKKMMRMFLLLEEHERRQPLQRIKVYQFLIGKIVKGVLDWLFPKKNEADKYKTIAQNLVEQWKQKEIDNKETFSLTNANLLKQASYIKQIEELQTQMLHLKSTNNTMQDRLHIYERVLQIKGGELAAYFRKMMEGADLEESFRGKIGEALNLFTSVAQQKIYNNGKEETTQKFVIGQIPLVLSDKLDNKKKKAPPILKKNIYGYYQQPQLTGNFTSLQVTKNHQHHRHTQTLPQDLCILTLHPVLLVTLIDGTLKPQRNRHSLNFYVRICVNKDKLIHSFSRQSLEPMWNQQFLLKDYDFPFIMVYLMHKSKGLKDYSLGGGKFQVSTGEKIVNIRNQKQFHGRVRFQVSYPKGNIFQFKITSAQLILPQGKRIMKQKVSIICPLNEDINIEFGVCELMMYMERSVIILQNYEGSMEVQLPNQHKKQQAPLSQFSQTQGSKEVIFQMGEDWKVVIQGEVCILICQDQEPQTIAEDVIRGARGKFFSVRAAHPITTVTYSNLTLHSNIKFPLVFRFNQLINQLQLVKQLYNRTLQQQAITPIINSQGFLKLSGLIKAPSKIYQFFIQTSDGETVCLKHENHLFERLVKQIKLYISYKEDQLQQINYSKKGNKNKPDKLYKEFAIQSQQLMLNHYKVFTRHFKNIGFIKFKLGYTIHDNQLKIESESPKKGEYINQVSMYQGKWCLQIQLSKAHLRSQSANSSYSILLNTIQSSKQKGNNPSWYQTFTISFTSKQGSQPSVEYKVIEDGMFGSKVLYGGRFVINRSLIALGSFIVKLAEGDCLHFQSVFIPREVYCLDIQSIEAEIEEEADWIGKIDPYIKLFIKNRQVLKTDYLDNIGANPIWQHLNFQTTTGKGEGQIMRCKLYDYDVIGSDDYLGEVVISNKMNQDIDSVGSVQILRGNLVKGNQMCGSLKIIGHFKKFNQTILTLGEIKQKRLNYGDAVCRLAITNIDFLDNKSYLSEERGWLQLLNKQNKLIKQKQIVYEKGRLVRLDFIYWMVNQQEVSLRLRRQRKSFFKTVVQDFGFIKITLTYKEFTAAACDIIDDRTYKIGTCHFIAQFHSNIRYSMISSHSCCKSNIFIKTDLNDSFELITTKLTQNMALSDSYESQYIFYDKSIDMFIKQQNEMVLLTKTHIKDNLWSYGYVQEKDGQGVVAVVVLTMGLTIEAKLSQRSQKRRGEFQPLFKKLKYLRWEPNQFRPNAEYQLKIKLRQEYGEISLHQTLGDIYNHYILLQPNYSTIIFDQHNLPQSIQVKRKGTQQQNISINLSQNKTKIMVPNKGALYCELQDFNRCSLLEIHFEYLYIRIKDIIACEASAEVSIEIKSTLNNQMFAVKSILLNNCFLLKDIKIYLSNVSHSDAYFFEAKLYSNDAKGVRKEIKFIKFGVKLQPNRQQYMFINNDDYILHVMVDNVLIERKYEPQTKKNLTIYGMSFIRIDQIQFEPNQRLSSRNSYIKLMLGSQLQRFELQRKGNTNLLKGVVEDSMFFIEQTSKLAIQIVQEGTLSNSCIGVAELQFVEINIVKQFVVMQSQVVCKGKSIGKFIIRYANLKEIPFVDINFVSYISRTDNLVMVVQLQKIGVDKRKRQRIQFASKGEQTHRVQSQDSLIIAESDVRDYKIMVTQKDSNCLLGEFKLCHELGQKGQIVMVLQPLRTSSEQINGLLVLEYEGKMSSNVSFQQHKDKHIEYVRLAVSHLALEKIVYSPKHQISISIKTASRRNRIKPHKFNQPTTAEDAHQFIIGSNQSCEMALFYKDEAIGSAHINVPYFKNQQRVVVFQYQAKLVGLCLIHITFLREQDTRLREIVAVQGYNFINTEIFTKMTPYLQLHNVSNGQVFISELGLGRQKIYWKLNLIAGDALQLVVKDKDMLFDDLIGQAVIPALSAELQQTDTFELTLFNKQDQQNRQGGNGTVRIQTVAVKLGNGLNLPILDHADINVYLLRLSQLNLSLADLLRNMNKLEVWLVFDASRIKLYSAQFDHLAADVQGRDIQLVFDLALLEFKYSETDRKRIPIGLRLVIQNQKSIVCSQEYKLGNYGHIALNQFEDENNKQHIFKIHELLAVQSNVIALKYVYIWLYEKWEKNITAFASSVHGSYQLNVVSRHHYLLILDASQLIDLKQKIMVNVYDSKHKGIVNFEVRVDIKDMVEQRMIFVNGIKNSYNKNIGLHYVQALRVHSSGQIPLNRQPAINKSHKKWLQVNIHQAVLTKDLQLFSKMDPYCKMAISQNRNYQASMWIQTDVQDNIGLHPIWNEVFMLPIGDKSMEQEILMVVVMDSEVTKDREVGHADVAMSKLILGEQLIQIQVLYEGKEKAGLVIFQAKIIQKYIVFRAVSSPYPASQQQMWVYMKHETNKITRNGIKIQIGRPYPLDESLSINLSIGKTSQIFNMVDLRINQSRRIIFYMENIALSYELFE